MPRRVMVVTGTRADYGLLRSLLQELTRRADVEVQIVATGMHLSSEFGQTWREIVADGFTIAARVRMLLSDDSPAGIAKSTGLGTMGFADAVENLQPHVVVVLGDRFEAFAAAQAALFARVPLAHIHGGELSEGAVDDAMRHAITKMAHLHFVAADAYAARVRQLGESPESVFRVGAPGLDGLVDFPWLSRAALEADLGRPLGRPLMLATYHPETLSGQSPDVLFAELLSALDQFPDASVVLTYPNADTSGRVLIPMVDAYAAKHSGRVSAHVSLGRTRYLSLMRECDVVVGNSSSGLIEAPALHRATVNVGGRQAGRLRAASVIDAAGDAASIAAAIGQALSPGFQAGLASTRSPYGHGGAASAIADVLLTADLDRITHKRFHDQSAH